MQGAGISEPRDDAEKAGFGATNVPDPQRQKVPEAERTTLQKRQAGSMHEIDAMCEAPEGKRRTRHRVAKSCGSCGANLDPVRRRWLTELFASSDPA